MTETKSNTRPEPKQKKNFQGQDRKYQFDTFEYGREMLIKGRERN